MLDPHCSDTPYINIIISAYSLVNIMFEATSSSQNYCTCSLLTLGKQSFVL